MHPKRYAEPVREPGGLGEELSQASRSAHLPCSLLRADHRSGQGSSRRTPRARRQPATLRDASFVQFKKRSRRPRRADDTGTSPVLPMDEQQAEEQSPIERMVEAYREYRAAIEEEILDRVKQTSPRFFEQLVVDLLLAMGYGGSRADAGRAVGQSGDGGIDGIINEDRLGLDVIDLQAKKMGICGRPPRNPEVRRRPAWPAGRKGCVRHDFELHQGRA